MRTDRDKAGAIQAFEFCYELTWKILKRALESQGLEASSPKDTFRKAAKEGFITDPELWFEFQQKRNLTVRTYEQENIESVITIFDNFSNELSAILIKIENLE